MEIKEEILGQIISLVNQHFPGWNSIADERFVKDEIDYKRKAIKKANELLGQKEYGRLIEEKNYEEIIKRLEKIGHSSNLLFTAVPMNGDLNILYQKNLDKYPFLLALRDLIYGEGSSPRRLEKYCNYIKENNLPNKWTFPTYFLFLFQSQTDCFVRPKVAKWFLDYIGEKDSISKYPSSDSYSLFISACNELKKKYSDYGVRDMVDVQSIIWVAYSVLTEKTGLVIDEKKTAQFGIMYKEFISSYRNQEVGLQHAKNYEIGRLEAVRNYAEIVSAESRGEDIEDLVLLKMLPYSNSEGNRAKGAWMPVAPAITGDLKGWFEAKNWAKPEDWPQIGNAILHFIRNANDDPSKIGFYCKEFDSLGYSKGFQSGMLTPILNALKPNKYIILNNKSRKVVNYLLDAAFTQNIKDYPAVNSAVFNLIEQYFHKMRGDISDEISDGDLFDMFCHWLVAVKKYDFGKVKYWKIAPGGDAWNWETCRNGGFIAIGWDEIGDISGLSRKEFDLRWVTASSNQPGWTKTASNQVWNFVQLEEGDKIVANKGTSEVLGLGIITGNYYFVPGIKYGHRVPVNWYDLTNRLVKQDGWRRTIIKLTAEEFDEISTNAISPLDDRSTTFSPRSFDLLLELHKSPTKEFYGDHREEIKSTIEEPIRRIFQQVANKLPQPILDVMETEKKVFGRFAKNDWGKGGTWDFYWGAFYPKGGKRTEDAQLFIWINREMLRFGFYIGEYGSDQREKFVKNCRNNIVSLTEVLRDTLPEGLVFYDSSGPKTDEKPLFAKSFVEWMKDLGNVGIHAAIILGREDALKISEEALVERITEVFKGVYPFVILATSDEPMAKIQEYLNSEPPEQNLEYPISKCSEDTGFDEIEIEAWISAIGRKGQAIIYGPPGTGKTYLAERLAKNLIGGGDGFIEFVQFHPAYAYEDFIQGIRPKSRAEGTLEYPIVPGRFMEFCFRAKKSTGKCVLIIDEINRANLARVFGEMMYLLEYRKASIPLAAGGELQIPENVRIIGTMNTADRSIALVDHALRRRFAFISLYPNYDVLSTFHEETGFKVGGLIEVLRKLNSQIGDRHYEVGITFFLRKDIEKELKDIWRMEIEPYLEEYFFDQRKKVDEFRWEQVATSIFPEVE